MTSLKTEYALSVVSDIRTRIYSNSQSLNDLKQSFSACCKLALRIEFKRCFSSEATALETMQFIQDNLKTNDLEVLKQVVSLFYLKTGYQKDEAFFTQVAESMLATSLPEEPLPSVEALKDVLIRYKMAVVLYLLSHVLYW